MRSIAEAKLPIGLFVALLAFSTGLKAALGLPLEDLSRARPGLFEDELARDLQSQGFSARREDSTIFATRGDCRLSVRDASRAESELVVYTRDAAQVGHLRYLFAGRHYESPPTLEIFAGRIEAKFLHVLRVGSSVPIAVALATSPACAENDFRLGDIRVPV